MYALLIDQVVFPRSRFIYLFMSRIADQVKWPNRNSSDEVNQIHENGAKNN